MNSELWAHRRRWMGIAEGGETEEDFLEGGTIVLGT